MTAHRKALLVLAVFLLALGTRLVGISFKSIWMDEDLQADRAAGNPFDPILVNKAATQQQPPIDYVLEAISLRNFGMTPVGARFGAALGGALAVAMLLFIAMDISGHRLVWGFAALVGICHPLLIRYGQEGRPVSTAILFSTVHLWMTTRILLWPERLRDPTRFIGLVLATLGLLWSIGFQPVVYLSVSSLSLTPLLAMARYRRTVLLVYLATGIALLIALPVLGRTFPYGGGLLKTHTIPSMIGLVWQGAFSISASEILDRYLAILKGGALFAAALVVIGAVGIARQRRDFRDSHLLPLTAYLALFAALFPLIFDTMYQGLIAYRIVVRYYLVFLPPLTVFLAAMLHFVVDALPAASPEGSPRSKGIAVVALVVSAMVAVYAFQAVSEVYWVQRGADWRGMYRMFHSPDLQGSQAYMMNLVEKGRYDPFFVARRFYYREKTPPVSLHSLNALAKHYRKDGYWDQCPKVFLCTMYGYRKVPSHHFADIPFIQVHHFGALLVMAVSPKGTMRQAVLHTFRLLSQKVQPQEGSYRIFETLYRLERMEKNETGMRQALARLKQVNESGSLDDLIGKLENPPENKKP